MYRGHNHATSVAKFSPSGNWVASGDASGRVRVWAWDNPEHILKLEVGRSVLRFGLRVKVCVVIARPTGLTTVPPSNDLHPQQQQLKNTDAGVQRGGEGPGLGPGEQAHRGGRGRPGHGEPVTHRFDNHTISTTQDPPPTTDNRQPTTTNTTRTHARRTPRYFCGTRATRSGS